MQLCLTSDYAPSIFKLIGVKGNSNTLLTTVSYAPYMVSQREAHRFPGCVRDCEVRYHNFLRGISRRVSRSLL